MTTMTTHDGITLHLIRDTTLARPHGTGGETLTYHIAAVQTHPVETLALNSTRGWTRVTGRPWTQETTDPTRHPAVAGLDPDDTDAVDAAAAWVAHRVRRTLADTTARHTYTDRERTRATAEADRLRRQITPGGRGRALTARDRLRALHCELTARGLLDPGEIADITGLDHVPGLPDHGTEQPRVLYGPAEIAIRAGLARGTVDRYIAEGRLPHETAPRLWDPEDIERWTDARTR